MEWVIFAVLLLLNSLAGLAVALVMKVRNIRKPGSKMLQWLFIVLALWTFSYAFITLSPAFNVKVFWLKIENIGIVATPPIWFLFTLSYTSQGKRIEKLAFALLFLIPGITLMLLFSGSWFELYYASVTRFSVEGLGPLMVKGANWYLVQLIYSYFLLLAGFLILIRHLFVFRDVYRRRIVTLMAAFIVPVLLNLFYHLGGNVFATSLIKVDLAPVSLTITASLLTFAIFNQKLFETTPIARHVLLDYIVEMVLVVDEENHVLDANQAASKWLGRPIDAMIGDTLDLVLAHYPKIVEHYKNSKLDEQSFHFFTEPEYLEMTLSPIKDYYDHISGCVLVFHDVAEQRQMERELHKANKELKAKLVEIGNLQVQLREQAIRDPLTGLYNRRYLAEALEHEMALAERENHPISAVIMDVDHFKIFNDQYGHKCGDHVLEYLSEMLLTNTRRGDTVCRYGGEEFVIIMPKVNIRVAEDRAESWRRKFAGAVISYDGHEMQAQLSAGVACYPVGVKNGEDLLKAADQALYYAKAHGRNRVTTYPLKEKEYV